MPVNPVKKFFPIISQVLKFKNTFKPILNTPMYSPINIMEKTKHMAVYHLKHLLPLAISR